MAGAAPPHTRALVRDLRGGLCPGVARIASDGFADFAALTAAGPAAKGMYVGSSGLPNDELPPTGRRFLEWFEKARAGEPPDFTATYTAQATDILLDSIARSDGTRPSVTRELRRTIIEDGILGDIRFDQNGDLVEAAGTIFRLAGRRAIVDRVITVRSASRRGPHSPRSRSRADRKQPDAPPGRLLLGEAEHRSIRRQATASLQPRLGCSLGRPAEALREPPDRTWAHRQDLGRA
jgi:Periplasmic binding protein